MPPISTMRKTIAQQASSQMPMARSDEARLEAGEARATMFLLGWAPDYSRVKRTRAPRSIAAAVSRSTLRRWRNSSRSRKVS